MFVGNSWTDDIAGARAAGLRAIFLDPQMTAGIATGGSGITRVSPTLAAIRSALREHG